MQTLLDETAAAEQLTVSKGTLANWRCSGLGGPKYLKIGRLVRYRTEDLEAFLNARTVDPAQNRLEAVAR